ncbi:HIT family protein [Candidatus Pacearchaeota archaeon ex4484_71]|nr:MAG: HIT family protein [Candidatus Pacearchaeota archaeon ex4484_71]
MEDCIFCKILRGEVPPGKGKISESDNFVAFLDINPEKEGHCLVVSKAHFETILDLPVGMGSELLTFLKEVSLKVMDKYECDGFNIVQNNFKSSGQVVPHLHFHIIPRKKDDPLNLKL